MRYGTVSPLARVRVGSRVHDLVRLVAFASVVAPVAPLGRDDGPCRFVEQLGLGKPHQLQPLRREGPEGVDRRGRGEGPHLLEDGALASPLRRMGPGQGLPVADIDEHPVGPQGPARGRDDDLAAAHDGAQGRVRPQDPEGLLRQESGVLNGGGTHRRRAIRRVDQAVEEAVVGSDGAARHAQDAEEPRRPGMLVLGESPAPGSRQAESFEQAQGLDGGEGGNHAVSGTNVQAEADRPARRETYGSCFGVSS